MPATILSRCQRFDFRRPAVMEVVGVLAGIAQQEGIEVAEAPLTVIARAAGGSFRDAIGILDQLSTYSGGAITLQQTLDILGIVQHDLLFEIVDLVHERDTQGALLFVERLSQGGTDYTQFIKDLLGHLRDLYVVKHTGEVPASIAMTEEQLAGAAQPGLQGVDGARRVAFIDLLGEALRSVRQGSDARLELELVLIKMTATHVSGLGRSGIGRAAAGSSLRRPAGGDAAAPSPSRRSPRAAPPAPAPAPADGRPRRHALPEPDAKPAADSAGPDRRRSRSPSGAGRARDARGGAAADAAGGRRRRLRHAGRPRPPPPRAGRWCSTPSRSARPASAAVLAEGRPGEPGGRRTGDQVPRRLQASRPTRWRAARTPRSSPTRCGRSPASDLQVVTRAGGRSRPRAGAQEEDARILSKDELIWVLKQEFDARVIDDGPAPLDDADETPGDAVNPNYQKMMKQVQKMQADMAKMQEDLANEVVEASAGGGMVTVQVTGAIELKSIKIDPAAVDPEDVEMLEDMIMAATNEALRSAQELANKKLGGITSGLNIPGLPF